MKKKIVLSFSIFVLIGILVIIKPKEKLEKIRDEQKTIAVYIKQEDGSYQESTSIPQKGYLLNTSKSVCSNGAKPTWEDNSLKLNQISSHNTNCYLYFDAYCKSGDTACQKILEDKMVNIRDKSSGVLTMNTTGKMYAAEDDDGMSYYFAGEVNNNWLKFAGLYWRIVRVNGDGTVRLIYNGATTDQTGETTQIGTSKFNENYNDNMYVGYRYTANEVHGTGTASTIQGVVDNWYKTNIVDKGFSGKVDTNTGFCGDREPSTSNSTSNGLGGTGTTNTYYGAYIRLRMGGNWNSSPTPTLKCKNTSDLYTVSGASKGNKSLTHPVGLITADEVNIAGTAGDSNYYLYTGQVYWTMSPSMYPNTLVFIVHSNGRLNDAYVNGAWGVRPVINLKANVTLTGSGTTSDPYIVEGAA